MPPQGALIFVKEGVEVVVLPAAQVALAGAKQVAGMADVAVLPFALGQGDLAGIGQPLGLGPGRVGLDFLILGLLLGSSFGFGTSLGRTQGVAFSTQGVLQTDRKPGAASHET